MFGHPGQNEHGFLPRMRVVHGSTFDGAPYQIALEDDEIGLGSSARIRKGYILGSDPLVVAVKVFGELLSRTKQEILVRELHFAREVSLCHEHILAFLGTATLGEQTAIVSLHMKNGNLMEYIKRNPECDKKKLILEVSEAVEFLHVEKRLVHGDLKCENVLVSDFGNAVLADFGLSSFVEKSETLSTTITIIRQMNTFQFAAPELLGVPAPDDSDDSLPYHYMLAGPLTLDDDAPVSKKTTASDVYAFGMLILQAISEEPPWGRKNQAAVIKSLSAGQHPPRSFAMSVRWWDICRSCWTFKPYKRPDIGHVLSVLKATEAVPRELQRELPFQEHISSAAYTPDGGTIIAFSHEYVMMVFDIATDQIRHLPHGAEDPERDMFVPPAVSPDGRHFACCSENVVLVLDFVSGALVTTLLCNGLALCVAFSPDNTIIAAGTRNGTVQLWDMATGAAVGPHLIGHTGPIDDVSFSPDGTCLASGSDDGTIRLWDSMTCASMATLKQAGPCHEVWSVQFSPDGMHIVAGDEDGRVIIWDVRGRHSEQIYDTRGRAVLSVAFSPSGKYIAAGEREGGIKIWDVQDRNFVGALSIGLDHDVDSIAFSPDGKRLLSTAEDGKVRVWDLFD